MNPTSKKEEFSSTMEHIYQRLGLLDDRLNRNEKLVSSTVNLLRDKLYDHQCCLLEDSFSVACTSQHDA